MALRGEVGRLRFLGATAVGVEVHLRSFSGTSDVRHWGTRSVGFQGTPATVSGSACGSYEVPVKLT